MHLVLKSTITVLKNSWENKSRDYSKRYPCLYRQKLVLKLIPDHLLRHYGNEDDVKTLKPLPAKSEERMLFISKLRGMGNFQHDKAAILSGKGKIMVAYHLRRAYLARSGIRPREGLAQKPNYHLRRAYLLR